MPSNSKYLGGTLREIAAGAAANIAYTDYIDMEMYDACSLQIEWTPGGGGGTLSTVIYGSIQDDTTAAASVVYQDITDAVIGAAAITGDAMVLDEGNVLGTVRHIKIISTIANKDASTALTILYRKKRG